MASHLGFEGRLTIRFPHGKSPFCSTKNRATGPKCKMLQIVQTTWIEPQKQLFRWNEAVEKLGDLGQLKLVIDYLPDEELMQALEKVRGNGRHHLL
ncbi:MAG TPA: hypothetical protein PLU15_08400, partial [Bacillota bacterium]|nr:hypothetical protein [Bacillota bacterium]